MLQQYTAEEGFQVVFIQETNVDPSTGDSERLSYSGWDGLGESADAYAPAQVCTLCSPWTVVSRLLAPAKG